MHRHISEAELASYLMYPKVFVEYAARRRRTVDVSVLPSPAFFYGRHPGEEINSHTQPGKRRPGRPRARERSSPLPRRARRDFAIPLPRRASTSALLP